MKRPDRKLSLDEEEKRKLKQQLISKNNFIIKRKEKLFYYDVFPYRGVLRDSSRKFQ